jgi:predicted nucleic acid-binding protein
MPDAFVIDASVVAKWFNKGESYEDEALALRNAWIDGNVELFSPSLVIFEVCNSVWKNPNIYRDQASSLSRLVVRLVPTLLEVGEVQSSETMKLARTSKLTFYDAVYIVLSSYQRFPLITADQDQLQVGKDYTKSIHIGNIRELLRS